MADKKRSAQMDTLKKVLRYIARYRLLVAVSLLLAALSVALTLYVPIVVGDAIDFIVEAGRVDFAQILRCLVVIGVVVAITAVAQWAMNIINNKITYQVIRDIRKEAFHKLTILPLKYIDSHPTGEIVSRVIADVAR